METIKALAYVMCEPQCKSQTAIKKQILALKKKYLIEDTKKSNIDIRKASLNSSDDFQNIYSVLEASLRDKDVKDEILSIISHGYVDDWTMMMRDLSVSNTEIFDQQWYLYSDFLKENYSMEEIEQSLADIKDMFRQKYPHMSLKEPFTMMTRLNKEEETLEIKESDYIKDKLKLLTSAVSTCRYVLISMNAPEEFEDDHYASIKRDFDANARKVEAINKRKAMYLTNGKVPSITEEEELLFLFDSAVVKVSSEYILEGFDLPVLLRTADFSDKELRNTILKAYKLHTIRYGELKNKEFFAEMVIRLLAIAAVSKKTEKFYKNRSVVKEESKDLKAAKKRIAELQQKNEALMKKAQKPQQKDPRDDRIKALLSEIATLNKTIRQKDKEIEILSCDNMEAELIAQENVLIPDDTLERFEEFIEDHRVLIWGLRDADGSKIQEQYPTLKFVSSDSRLNQKQLSAYDVILLGTGYTNHGSFWTTRDCVKSSGKPFAYMKKFDKSIEALSKAWAIAVREA